MNRRKFMSSAIATAGVLTGFEAISDAEKAPFQFAEKFSLKIFGTNWGFVGNTDAFCAAIKKEGYDGLEIWWPGTKEKQKELFVALKKYSLDVGFLCGSGEKEYAKHLDVFKKQINAASTEYEQKPLYINCHSGKDFFDYEQNKAFIDHTTAATAKTGIPIYHETHRGRMLFAAHIARDFMEKNPELKLTLDISHWCNVHESLLQDQQETVKLALSRTGHIHSRIGHEEGPQVNDPRAPEWEATVKAHLAWWDAVVEQKVKSGETLTVLTEFGPPHYLPTVPFTNQPLADQWAINVHMMHLFRKRYLK
ncbi:sugar phosphate isomerase/epimerase [Dyadobacter sp. CY343]|uniref:sugar phosphate isomerase/epimerase family protein n=1 Tax=Dyadobacter sp. CY343 TaxID=2907299 RepID=UPI001F39C62C|nr:sugar phosphate isomerase/epimerase [Dyadobacter sp. CY343]MCE7062940.1 sugar phosphate isomerase/epimerase [Dyadobacter sp. CY343]